MNRGFVQDVKFLTANKQEAILISAGISARVIYRDFDAACRSLRPGDRLAIAEGLRVLGQNRDDILIAVSAVHAKDAEVMSVPELGGDDVAMFSRKDGVQMFAHALAKIRGASSMVNIDQARLMQINSVKARTRDGRLPLRQAERIWFDLSISPVKEAARLTGWSQTALYLKLGKRVPDPPPPKPARKAAARKAKRK